MFCIRLSLSVCLLSVISTSLVIAEDRLEYSFPSIPPDYEELQAPSLVADSKVTFPTYYIDWTNGYKVTAPSGAQFVVDNIAQPKCAFYGTYISNDANGYLGLGGGNGNAVVDSKVYIGEVNFDKCQ